MNHLPAWAVLLLFSGPLTAQESSSPPVVDAKDLPTLNQAVSTPEIKPSNLTKATDYIPSPSNTSRQAPTYTKEQLEALNKNRNWAVEGLKDRRESERLEKEELSKTQDNSLNDLLENERKSIDERMGRASSSMNQFKPSIETDWNSVNNKEKKQGVEKELSAQKNDLQTMGQLQSGWMQDSWNSKEEHRKESPQVFDSLPPPSTAANLPPAGERNSLQSLQNQMNDAKGKNESHLDYLVGSGQAQNFRKLSNDPNYQPPSASKTGPQPSINAVPAVPQAVTSTMNLETMRQIEQQRVNAIPKPDFKELNSRIPAPGNRRF